MPVRRLGCWRLMWMCYSVNMTQSPTGMLQRQVDRVKMIETLLAASLYRPWLSSLELCSQLYRASHLVKTLFQWLAPRASRKRTTHLYELYTWLSRSSLFKKLEFNGSSECVTSQYGANCRLRWGTFQNRSTLQPINSYWPGHAVATSQLRTSSAL